MANKFDEMREAINEAKHTLAAADHVAQSMALLLVDRLHKVDRWTLVKLKRELQKFDAHKKQWKS